MKRLEGWGFPSTVKLAKAAAWPWIGWLNLRSTEYSCMSPTTRFCCTTKEGKVNCLSHNTVLLHNKGRQRELLHHITQFCCTTKEDKANYLSPTWFCCTTKTKWTTPASGACTQQTKMCQSNWHHWPMNSLSSNPSDVLSYTNNIHTQVSEQTHTAKGFGRSL